MITTEEEVTVLKDSSFETNNTVKNGLKNNVVSISKATEGRLLEEFEKVKKQRFYLKPKISLADLAALIGTNERYMSYILRKYTGMDFNNYLQHARIGYLIECVEREPDLLNEKFSVLADKGGFSDTSKFSAVFKNVKGVSPSEYFQKIRN